MGEHLLERAVALEEELSSSPIRTTALRRRCCRRACVSAERAGGDVSIGLARVWNVAHGERGCKTDIGARMVQARAAYSMAVWCFRPPRGRSSRCRGRSSRALGKGRRQGRPLAAPGASSKARPQGVELLIGGAALGRR